MSEKGAQREKEERAWDAGTRVGEGLGAEDGLWLQVGGGS